MHYPEKTIRSPKMRVLAPNGAPSGSSAEYPARIGLDLPAGPAFSVFHEPWWLDIATDKQWGEAIVRENGAVIGRWPYPIGTKFGLPTSTLPTLIRTLGPAIAPLPGKPARAYRRRHKIVNLLIDQLPRAAYFEQLFDPRITDGAAFAHRGFGVGVTYTFRIEAGQPIETTWHNMLDKTRNAIRKAETAMRVETIDPDEFCRFYNEMLGAAENMHGAERMRALVAACVDRGGTIIGARDPQGALVAATTFVSDCSTMYFLLSARDARASASTALSLVIWRGMRLACERGLAFDLDGVNSPGMLLFLSGFGATLTQRLRVRRMKGAYRVVNLATNLLPLAFAGFKQRLAR
jgi:hypothetical protein